MPDDDAGTWQWKCTGNDCSLADFDSGWRGAGDVVGVTGLTATRPDTARYPYVGSRSPTCWIPVASALGSSTIERRQS